MVAYTRGAMVGDYNSTPYAGIGSPQAIEYFHKLGVTAVELLPVHHFINSQHLLDKGLVDYWGYNSIGFFSPDSKYSSSGDAGQQVTEFKSMVNSLHNAGIEVILDVVYNHTVEGNHLGPTLAFRGIDNAAYYRLVGDNPRYYNDYTGTGNTLNVPHPRVLQMVMDSLRYWVTEMHVDGFRFDLASTLARGQQALVVLRCHPSGSDHFPGETDRGAVGCGRGRLSSGQFPRALGGVEWTLSRHCAALLERRRRRHQ